MTFLGESRADAEVQAHIHESPPVMIVPLIILAIPAALLGLVLGLPPEGGWIHTFLEPVFFERRARRSSTWAGEGGLLMLVSLVAVLVGHRHRLVALRAPHRGARPHRRARAVGVQGQSQQVVHRRDLRHRAGRRDARLRRWLWTFFDVKVIDGAVNGVARLWGWVGDGLRPIQTGRVQNYAMYVFGGMVVLVVVLAWVWGS